MLKGNVAGVVPAKNLDESRKFYEDVLGLEVVDEHFGGITYRSGNGQLFLYETEFAGTNKATNVCWVVDDVEAIVEELTNKGIEFEEYDEMEGVERDGAIHTMGEMKAAWFRDPAGNILNVVSLGESS